jgi:hypothetical protein
MNKIYGMMACAAMLAVAVTGCDKDNGNPTTTGTGGEPLALTGSVTIPEYVENGIEVTANTDNLGGSGAISYQWMRVDAWSGSTTWVDIGGQTNASYTPTSIAGEPNINGQKIKVRVSRADNTGSAYSNESMVHPVGGGIIYETWADRLTGSVTIPERVENRVEVTANIDNLGGSGEIRYQWMREEPWGSNIWINIEGETNANYTTNKTTLGEKVKVRVSRADNAGYVFSNELLAPIVAIDSWNENRFGEIK